MEIIEELIESEAQAIEAIAVGNSDWLRCEALLYLQNHGHSNQSLMAHAQLSATQLRHHLRVAKKLCESVKQFLRQGQLSFAHARTIAGYAQSEQESIARDVIAKKISSRRLEALRRNRHSIPAALQLMHYYEQLADKISEHIGHPVAIVASSDNPNRGSLSIHFADLDCFDSILERLRVPLDALN